VAVAAAAMSDSTKVQHINLSSFEGAVEQPSSPPTARSHFGLAPRRSPNRVSRYTQFFRRGYTLRGNSPRYDEDIMSNEDARDGRQERTLQIATTVKFRTDEVTGLNLKNATHAEALLFNATPHLLAVSRRAGGLLHNAGRITVDGIVMGILSFLGDDEGHMLIVPLGAPEVVALLDKAGRRGTLFVVASAPATDARLIVVDATTLDAWRPKGATVASRQPKECMVAMADVASQLLGTCGTDLLPPTFDRLAHVFISVVLPDSIMQLRQQQRLDSSIALH
jgi:hypothetical protein